MHDPRTSPALRTLTELTSAAQPRRWAWSIRRLDDAGRLSPPMPVASALGPPPWRIRWHHLALVVEPDPTDDGTRAAVDDRRRLTVPVWLRQRSRNVLVGLDGDAPLLLVAPAEVLDRTGDVLAGGQR